MGLRTEPDNAATEREREIETDPRIRAALAKQMTRNACRIRTTSHCMSKYSQLIGAKGLGAYSCKILMFVSKMTPNNAVTS